MNYKSILKQVFLGALASCLLTQNNAVAGLAGNLGAAFGRQAAAAAAEQNAVEQTAKIGAAMGAGIADALTKMTPEQQLLVSAATTKQKAKQAVDAFLSYTETIKNRSSFKAQDSQTYYNMLLAAKIALDESFSAAEAIAQTETPSLANARNLWARLINDIKVSKLNKAWNLHTDSNAKETISKVKDALNETATALEKYRIARRVDA